MKFSEYDISEDLKEAIADAGFVKPTDIQFKSIPPILRGEDVLAIAQTGTGKTAAFAIPILNVILKRKVKGRTDGIKCLVMVPTHELALQLDAVFKELSKNTKLVTFSIYGGVDQDPQIARLNKGVDILFATPGRMFDLVSQGVLHLNRVEILVLDEADHMLDLGFIKDIRDLIQHLPKKRQTLFFSATINEEIKKLAYSLVKNAIRIQISPKNPVAKNIEHAVAYIEMDDKRFFLESMVKENDLSKILVFVRTKIRAERVKQAMARVGITTDTIHSDRLDSDRKNIMKNFRSGELKILIATDISARGIDIPNVDFVINYDMPESAANYVHRVGRTGRGNVKGQAISFCSEQEKAMLSLIEENLGQAIQELEISMADYKLTVEASTKDEEDWQSLMKAAAAQESKKSKKKKKR